MRIRNNIRVTSLLCAYTVRRSSEFLFQLFTNLMDRESQTESLRRDSSFESSRILSLDSKVPTSARIHFEKF